MSLARNFTIVGGATMASRLSGFVRDMLVAAALGATAIADAYVAAFLLPNLFRRLIGEGAFNASFVPIFARREADNGRASAEAFFEAALSVMVAIGLAVICLGELAMPSIIAAVAPGFLGNPAKLHDAVAFGRIMFPFVGVILLVAVLNGALNALNRFAIAAWAPVLLNVALIVALTGALVLGLEGTRDAGFVLVWTVLAAGVLQLVIVAIGVLRAGLPLRLGRLTRDPDVRRLMLFALPGVAIAGAGHLNVVVAAQIASGTPSAVSWLYFAERLFQLPLGFVAAAVGVVLLPAMARHVAKGEVRAAREAESRALEFALLVTLPAAAALFLLAEPIVGILFERGAFEARDTVEVARMLRSLAGGLPAFVLVKVFLPAFLARERLAVPLMAALAGIVANLAVAVLSFSWLGPTAAALGVTVSAYVNAGILLIWQIRSGLFRPDKIAYRRVPRAILVSAASGFFLWFLIAGAGHWLDAAHPTTIRFAALMGFAATTIIVHIAMAQWAGAMDLRQVIAALRARSDP